MAPFKHKDGFGTVFEEDKEGNENRPDYKGKCTTPDGTELSLALWKSETKEGKPTLSVKIEVPKVFSKDESPI
tara:strand:- start:57 stop:275 length:219 start_codon:yes stop_codon:yes gene_type:complete